MNDIVQFNRLQTKCLETTFAISKIHNACQTMLTNPTQENLDIVAAAVQEYQEAGAAMDGCLQDFVKELVGEDSKMNSIKTDVGYKV